MTSAPPAGRPASLRERLAPHAGLAALLVLALPLLFAELGTGVLWADEGDTAVFARSILRHGVPYAWDGETFTDSDMGKRLTPNLVMVGTPWLPYYVTAASFALLGESVLAARLPFALAALASIALLYLWVWRATGERRTALVASALLVLSVQFLLYARECRHYALNVLLSLALLCAFQRLRERPRGIGLIAAAVALFHTHPLPAGATLAALGGLTLLHPDYRPLRRVFWTRLLVVVPLTLPWMFWSWSGWEENSSLLASLGELPTRWVQFGWEASVAVPWLAWLVLVPLTWARLSARDRSWLALVAFLLASYAALTPLLLDTGKLWMFGLRYVCALLALGAAASALLVVRASGGRPAVLAALVALLGFTHLGANALPWLWFEPPSRGSPGSHVPQPLVAKILRTEWLGFARELRAREPGTLSKIIEVLHREAAPGDRLITNYDWEPLTFHTRLPQALKILDGYPIEAAAREAGLPDYVFGIDRARWLVWRLAWEGYRGYKMRNVARAITQGGGRPELVARLPETIWENRPELHFHRFPGLGALYPSTMMADPEHPPSPAMVMRIDWPEEPAP